MLRGIAEAEDDNLLNLAGFILDYLYQIGEDHKASFFHHIHQTQLKSFQIQT